MTNILASRLGLLVHCCLTCKTDFVLQTSGLTKIHSTEHASQTIVWQTSSLNKCGLIKIIAIKTLGPVVRKVNSAIHWIVIFSIVV